MTPVFGHGRLRLYLLSLLDEAPRHGYEVIRLLEERFQGLYAPSAGTVYPRLAKLEQEGLVTHTLDGGRKVYALTAVGRAELAQRHDELADVESDIRESVAELAADIREDVHGSARDLREEMRRAASETQSRSATTTGPEEHASAENAPWREVKQEWRRAKQEAKEQARRARNESRQAREESRRAKEQSQRMRWQTQQEVLRVKEQLQDGLKRGTWPSEVTESLSELGRALGWPPTATGEEEGGGQPAAQGTAHGAEKSGGKAAGEAAGKSGAQPGASPEHPPGDAEPTLPEWARTDPDAEPTRELERLLDRFRDELRDRARDTGVTAEQLARVAHALARVPEKL